MRGKGKPTLLATVFSDYICPFCYVGDARLDRLREHYELKVSWCFVEIHPETPAQGMSTRDLGSRRSSENRFTAETQRTKRLCNLQNLIHLCRIADPETALAIGNVQASNQPGI